MTGGESHTTLGLGVLQEFLQKIGTSSMNLVHEVAERVLMIANGRTSEEMKLTEPITTSKKKEPKSAELVQRDWVIQMEVHIATPITWGQKKDSENPGNICIECESNTIPISWFVHPLEMGFAALPTSVLPKQRRGSPNPLSIPLDKWRASWHHDRLPLTRVLALPSFDFSFSTNLASEELGDTLSEAPSVVYKYPSESNIFPHVPLAHYAGEQQLSLLNTPGRKRFMFGVVDKTQEVIGVELDASFKLNRERFLPFFQETFPPQCLSVQVDVKHLSLDLHSWDSSLVKIGPLDRRTVVRVVQHCSGRAVTTEPVGNKVSVIFEEKFLSTLVTKYSQLKKVQGEIGRAHV